MNKKVYNALRKIAAAGREVDQQASTSTSGRLTTQRGAYADYDPAGAGQQAHADDLKTYSYAELPDEYKRTIDYLADSDGSDPYWDGYAKHLMAQELAATYPRYLDVPKVYKDHVYAYKYPNPRTWDSKMDAAIKRRAAERLATNRYNPKGRLGLLWSDEYYVRHPLLDQYHPRTYPDLSSKGAANSYRNYIENKTRLWNNAKNAGNPEAFKKPYIAPSEDYDNLIQELDTTVDSLYSI